MKEWEKAQAGFLYDASYDRRLSQHGKNVPISALLSTIPVPVTMKDRIHY